MSRLRDARRGADLSQAELADRAGVSRQLVGSVEAGRHLPRVDAALAIAGVLDMDVGDLFAPAAAPVDIVTGAPPSRGSMVRVGAVGNLVVTTPARAGPAALDAPDGCMVSEVSLEILGRRAPGLVVAGCEPGLDVLQQMLRESGMGAVAAGTSNRSALEALGAGRVHAAVVHGPVGALPDPPDDRLVRRFRLCRWQVGLAGPAGVGRAWFTRAIEERSPIIQRERGAGVQRSLEDAVGGRLPGGPIASGHLDAAWRSMVIGLPAVTIEPAALAAGAEFHPFDVHVAELWCGSEWLHARPVAAAFDVLGSRRFQSRLLGIGGYDLAQIGTEVA